MNDADDPVPVGINVGIGSVAVVAVALFAALLPTSDSGLRVGLLVLTVGGFAAVTADPRATVFVAAIGYLVFDGFLINEMGKLSWHGTSDLRRVVVCVAAVLVGLAVGTVRRSVRRSRRLAPVEAWANGSRPTARVRLDKGELRGA
jgi:hypothetical protein